MSQRRPHAAQFVAHFLANVLALEGEAAGHYAQFAQRALDAGDAELEAFFSSLAEATRLDLAEARSTGGLEANASVLAERLGALPGMPRTAVRVGSPALFDLHQAMNAALELKRRSHAYYAAVAAAASDPELRRIAQGFEREGAAHLEALEKWVVRLGA